MGWLVVICSHCATFISEIKDSSNMDMYFYRQTCINCFNLPSPFDNWGQRRMSRIFQHIPEIEETSHVN